MNGAVTKLNPQRMAKRLALNYGLAAAAWIIVSDLVELSLDLPEPAEAVVNTGKAMVFVIVTASLLYTFSKRFFSYASASHERYRRAQEQLRGREQSIQQAYVDVLAAVTGGKLILMWPDDVPDYLGDVVLPDCPINDPGELGAARARLAPALQQLAGTDGEALLAANEAITNALKHAGGGLYGVRKTSDALQIVIADHGPGIDFHTLPRATLIAGYSTKASLGLGFTIMFDAAERVLLATEPGLTTLVLEFPLPGTVDGPEPTPERHADAQGVRPRREVVADA